MTTAFSLVELLVVISILALLMSLLTPSMKRVFYSSSNLKCINNLKVIAVGFTIYAEDFNDHYPDVDPYPDAYDYRYPFKYKDSNNTNNPNRDLRKQIRPYFSNYCGDTFICPLTVEDERFKWTNHIEEGNPNQGSMSYGRYVGNFEVGKYASLAFSKPADRLGQPLVNAKGNGTSDLHPTLPESWVLAGDFVMARGTAWKGFTKSWPTFGWGYIRTWHQPSYNAAYYEKAGHHGQPPKFIGLEFSTNWVYQDGSSRAVKSFNDPNELNKTHAHLNQDGNNQEDNILPLEN